ncbi:4-hydroxyphenylpyruvate dioxygenase [Actinosynnema pretiosum subsp. pretiosum]|uniref:4-hydroxyphenylpyruvate dioxygenase n=3 Tax=Actinomycetes TaxID=1760 RepID=C6WLN0_ACTMD|nr:4-hydroxyphenylpyruvate dioxygenase [Actinosynnema mirum]AAT09803.1 NocF [Nocardia uniformis subsp. tsuyamanensis]ACU38423.1 4-hydroxyphenylpyruvate dioxygenase [Actinosynnema mirum DSM 43827]AXX31968.1 4-hydroxyphenylpyruvate dioxygenase [Actinosynnema pretiosum subsp. pretiosum]QUF04052.1 4-hydroxyphenylpyruvate dioxygenase [Actinosynnema pretiosum subsp. pretiosum]
MAAQAGSVFDGMTLDHTVFYVGDADRAAGELTDKYGLVVLGTSETSSVRSVAVGGGSIRLVFSQAIADDTPAAAYVKVHGDGVADLALGVADARAAFAEAVRRGARPVAEPTEADGAVLATIMGFGDVVHTFVQRPGGAPGEDPESAGGLRVLDHFAVCLEAGGLEPTVAFYQEVLDFRVVFEEKIVVGAQAMNSKVVQSTSGAVTLTLIEPDTSRKPGQIDDFIKNHGGAGVQHIAFATDGIVDAVRRLRERGVELLTTPAAYYDLLADRLGPTRYSTAELAELNLLVDEDQDGKLYQIFARSTHPRGTFFFEIIERAGAHTFGSGNIKALYEAVEAERHRTER